MRDLSELSVSAVRALFAEADGRRLGHLVTAYRDDPRPGVRDAVRRGAARLADERAEARRLALLYRIESELHRAGAVAVAGIDEVGRGAIAGPLSVGACVLPLRPRITGLDDSKRLTPAKREAIAVQVREHALAWSVVHIDAVDVDALGVTAALKRAMRAAVAALAVVPDQILVDGNPLAVFEQETAIVGGDRTVAAIAAASVIAKVERDGLMREFDERFPAYGFGAHKGYGTPEHLAAVAHHGPCELHRRTFCPGRGMPTLF